VAHVACGHGAFFTVKTVFFEHLSDLHVLFSDFEGFFGIIAEVLHVVTLSASHAQFAGDGNHLVANGFFFGHKLSNGLGMSLRNQQKQNGE